MLLNYHELTMDEPRNSPAKAKQFRLICLVMIICIGYTLITSGALRPVEVYEGVFPGGEFVYKTTGRDYAASMSLLESIAGDLGLKERHMGNIMYNLYVDDPLAVNGRRQRFASGILLNDSTSTPKHTTNEQRKQLLLQTINSQIIPPTPKELEELAAYELWPRLSYHSQQLPQVKAAVVEYKFSNGFASALLHSYKVFPAIRQYAKEHGFAKPGTTPVVLTTCFIMDSKCIHYVPLTDSENVFRLGKREYDASELGGGHINWKGVRKMLLKVMSFGQLGGDLMESTTTSTTIAKDSVKTTTTTTSTKEASSTEDDATSTTTTTTSQEQPTTPVVEEGEEEEKVAETKVETETQRVEQPVDDDVSETEQPPVEETTSEEAEGGASETATGEESPVGEDVDVATTTTKVDEDAAAADVPGEEPVGDQESTATTSDGTVEEETLQQGEEETTPNAPVAEEEIVQAQEVTQDTPPPVQADDSAIDDGAVDETTPEEPPATIENEAQQQQQQQQQQHAEVDDPPPIQEESPTPPQQRDEL